MDTTTHGDAAGQQVTQQSETSFTKAVQLGAQGTVLDACYSSGDEFVATITDADVVQIWDCSLTEPRWDLLHSEQLPARCTQLAWAHPQYGPCLAVGSSEGSVHIIQGPAPWAGQGSRTQQQNGHPNHPGWQQRQRSSDGWSCTARLPCGQEAVSALAFGPRQLGLVLAVACRERPLLGAAMAPAMGRSQVLLFEAAGQGSTSCLQWTLTSKIQPPDTAGPCSCLSWHAPMVGLPPLLAGGHSRGGCIWAYRAASMTWQEVTSFGAPPGVASPQLVSVHWAPPLGRPYEMIAASYGRTVVLYKLQQGRSKHVSVAAAAPDQQQQQQSGVGPLDVSVLQELHHQLPVWRLEFNALGNALACSLNGQPEVWLWMPVLEGTWQLVTKLAGSSSSSSSGGGGAEMDAGGVMVD